MKVRNPAHVQQMLRFSNLHPRLRRYLEKAGLMKANLNLMLHPSYPQLSEGLHNMCGGL